MKPEDVTDEMLRAFVNAPSPQLADDADLGDVAAGIAAAINAMPQSDAQAQIDALKAENEKLRKALVEFVQYADDCDDDSPELDRARAALANKEIK